ncbi:RNA 2'-phosphotransferase [Bacillus infantis]|uniref:RNA 2'-phosphotransferase n=1 Tax=Bacillus infantis TaxID=324767 RepID=UPI003CF6E23C
MITINYRELSKEVSYALRHAPSEYGLSLDENGWVELLKALKENNKWASIELNMVIQYLRL